MSISSFFAGLILRMTPRPEPIAFAPMDDLPFTGCFHADDVSRLLPHYNAGQEPFQALKNVVRRTEYVKDRIDFREIDALGSSKSKENHPTFATIFDFGKAVQAKENWSIDGCMRHIESRIFSTYGGAHLTRYRWNGLVSVSNCDGSHHFAAALYLLDSGTPYSGRTEYDVSMRDAYIDEIVAEAVFEKYDIYVVGRKTFNDIREKYDLWSEDWYRAESTNGNQEIIAIEKNPPGPLRFLQEELMRAASMDGNFCVFMNDYLRGRIQQQQGR